MKSSTMEFDIVIIGGGLTGLAAGMASKGLVLEATDRCGGMADCVVSGSRAYSKSGHWLFGGSDATKSLIDNLVLCGERERDAWVSIDKKYAEDKTADEYVFVRAPIQSNFSILKGKERIYAEMARGQTIEPRHFQEWLEATFGKTLCDIYFTPYNNKYTCGQAHLIEPLSMKNPAISLESLMKYRQAKSYNERFMYVVGGTHYLVTAMEAMCNVRHNSRVVGVNLDDNQLTLEDGEVIGYRMLISTIPIDEFIVMCGFDDPQLPYVATMCIDVVCRKINFPGQWAYFPGQEVFHRLGNYTVIDPALAADEQMAYIDINLMPDISRDAANGIAQRALAQVSGLIDGISEVMIFFTKHGYIFRRPYIGHEIDITVAELASKHDVFSIGGYGRWKYQGMMADIEDGLRAGTAARLIWGL